MSAIRKAAGTKVVSVVGIILAAAGTVCTGMHSDIEKLAGPLGVSICAGLAILGAIVAAVGKGLGDSRSGKALPVVRLPHGVEKVNERGTR